MLINELEKYLGITISEDQTPIYEARLEAAIDHVNGECNQAFTVLSDTGVESIEFPPVVKLGVSLLVKIMGEDNAIASRSLDDMSVSYFQGEKYKAARTYWKKFITVKVI